MQTTANVRRPARRIAGLLVLLALGGGADARAGDVRIGTNIPSGARVCALNISTAEQSCDGEAPQRLNVTKHGADNIDNRRLESFASAVLSPYVEQGFRVVSCFGAPGPVSNGGGPLCILVREPRS